MNLRMVISKDNEHEIEDFKRLAEKIGVDMVSLKAFSTRQPGYADTKIDSMYAPKTLKYRWYKYRSDYSADRRLKKYNCKFPWTKPMLFADGTIAFCEFDFKYEYPLGTINDNSFKDMWFSEQANIFRKRFKTNRDSVNFCQDCVFNYKLIPGCVLEWKFLNNTVHGK